MTDDEDATDVTDDREFLVLNDEDVTDCQKLRIAMAFERRYLYHSGKGR
jgi:hypothetical protein